MTPLLGKEGKLNVDIHLSPPLGGELAPPQRGVPLLLARGRWCI